MFFALARVKESYRKQKGIFLKNTKVKNYKLYTYGSRATSNKRVYMSVPVYIYIVVSVPIRPIVTRILLSPRKLISG
jgi:hypothetical protein